MVKILKFYFKSFNINSYITKYDFGYTNEPDCALRDP